MPPPVSNRLITAVTLVRGVPPTAGRPCEGFREGFPDGLSSLIKVRQWSHLCSF